MLQSSFRQRALGDFLRRHRELLIKPADSTPSAKRRPRTPGFRREEIAHLAGISTSWYARLEQGKEISPSSAALSRIAEVLHLAAAERAYLFHLAGRVDALHYSETGRRSIIGTIENCMGSIDYPAYVIDQYWTPILWNAELGKVFSVWLEGPEINLLRHMFIDPNARSFVADWELRARELLAQFRVDFGRHIDDPKMVDLVRSLKEESTLFRQVWNDQQVLFREGNLRYYDHPRLGSLKFLQTTFLAADEPSLKLVILIPQT